MERAEEVGGDKGEIERARNMSVDNSYKGSRRDKGLRAETQEEMN